MSKLNDPEELENYINDLVTNRQQHQNDEPLELVGALIYAIQNREFFNIDFEYYLRNVSYEEKKQIKDIIKYRSDNSTKPLTPQQERLFSKLVDSLPKDSLAKRNESRRSEENVNKYKSDSEFLKTAAEDLASLKRKLGEELKKKVVNVDTRSQLQLKITEVQERVQQLMQSTNPTIQKEAIKASQNVLDSDQQTQTKLNFIESKLEELRNIEVLTAPELRKIQEDLSTNRYAYSHLPQVREKAQQALRIISEVRSQQFTQDKMHGLTVLQTLNVHKQWGDGSKFEDQNFDKFTGEHIKDFFVMRPPLQSEEKNDIKMHVSIDPDQANEAMQIIHKMAQSEQYAGLIHEYKIGDIDYINTRIKVNSKNMTDMLSSALQGSDINVPELIAELKNAYPNVDTIIERVKSQVPEEKRANAENILKQVSSNELGAIITGERILHDALFTVYFKKDFTKDKLQAFCQELNENFQEQGIRNGNIAKTDVGVNAFCGVTIDHVMDPITGQKKYLEGSKPEDVLKRQRALRDNPLTQDLMPKIPSVQALSEMASHQDQKDYNGQSAFVTKGMTLEQIPLDQQVAFAGQLIAERFKQTNNVNLVYRNPDMFTKWVVKEVFNKLQFPVDPDKKKEFFELVERATGTPPDDQAKTQLQSYFSQPNPKPETVQMLQPFYDAYLKNVKEEFYRINKDIKDQLQYRDLLGQRVDEAKKQFLGHVSFPFVESLVFELQEKDGFSAEKKGKLAAGFRKLREQGMMDDLVKALDKGGPIPQLNDETVDKAFAIYEKGNRDYIGVKQQHELTMTPVRDRATELYKLVNKIASSLSKDHELKPIFEQIAGSIENTKTEIDHKLLRGEIITQQDVEKVNEQFDQLMTRAKNALNNTSLRSETPLHDAIRHGNKELVDVLLKAGTDPRLKTSNYKRGFFGAFKDAFSGKPGDFFKNLMNPIPRTGTQLARFLGQDDLVESLRAKEHELNNPTVPQNMTQKLETLEHLVEQNDNEVVVQVQNAPSVVNVYQLQSDKQAEKTNNDFAVGWLRRIDEQIKAIDKGLNNEQDSVILQALKDVKNFLEGRSKLEFKKDSPELKTLESVINRAKEASRYGFPPEVIQMFNQMKEGVILPAVNPIPDKVMGPKTEFVEKWDEHLTKMMEKGDVPKFMVEEIKTYLKLHQDIAPDNMGSLETVFKRIENAAKENMKPELKQVIDGMRNGVMPEDAPKVQMRRN
jgi:hypothetical protein